MPGGGQDQSPVDLSFREHLNMAMSKLTNLAKKYIAGLLPSSRRGAAAVEFAVISVPFLMLVIGILEVFVQMTTATSLDAAVLRASRFGITGQATKASLGPPPTVTCRSQSIPWIITRTAPFIRADRLQVVLRSFPSVSTITGPSTNGAGVGGQVVAFEITYAQPFITMAWSRLFSGVPASITHRVTMYVRNEPFENAVC
jgi:hypothetical protein